MKILTAIYDKKSNNFDAYQVFKDRVSAVRSFQMSCEKVEPFKKWPEDFKLISLAEISETGAIKEKMETLAEAVNYVQQTDK